MRAYADDLAIASERLHAVAAATPIFNDFARVFGRSLNLGKTTFIPSGDDQPDTIRRQLGSLCLGCGAAQIKFFAEYLGSYLGPDAAEKAGTRH